MFHREGIEKDLEISVRMLALQKRNTDSVNIEAKTPILSSHQKMYIIFLGDTHSCMHGCAQKYSMYTYYQSHGSYLFNAGRTGALLIVIIQRHKTL